MQSQESPETNSRNFHRVVSQMRRRGYQNEERKKKEKKIPPSLIPTLSIPGNEIRRSERRTIRKGGRKGEKEAIGANARAVVVVDLKTLSKSHRGEKRKGEGEKEKKTKESHHQRRDHD